MKDSLSLLTLWAMIAMATPALAADFKIIQKDKKFSESQIKINIGDQITFVNGDTVTHNVYSTTPGFEFDLRTQAPEQSDTILFRKAGIVEVQCAIHPKMRLRVDVTR